MNAAQMALCVGLVGVVLGFALGAAVLAWVWSARESAAASAEMSRRFAATLDRLPAIARGVGQHRRSGGAA